MRPSVRRRSCALQPQRRERRRRRAGPGRQWFPLPPTSRGCGPAARTETAPRWRGWMAASPPARSDQESGSPHRRDRGAPPRNPRRFRGRGSDRPRLANGIWISATHPMSHTLSLGELPLQVVVGMKDAGSLTQVVPSPLSAALLLADESLPSCLTKRKVRRPGPRPCYPPCRCRSRRHPTNRGGRVGRRVLPQQPVGDVEREPERRRVCQTLTSA